MDPAPGRIVEAFADFDADFEKHHEGRISGPQGQGVEG